MDIPSVSAAKIAGSRWGKSDDKQSHVDRFKNSRALFEKLEKENAAPNKPLTFKAGTSFGIKSRDADFRSKLNDKPYAGEPTSYSANAAQVRKTSNLINSSDELQENGMKSTPEFNSSPQLNHASPQLNNSEPEKPSSRSTNGHSSFNSHANGDTTPDTDDSDVFLGPRSEPAISPRHIFNRTLSSEVLPKPYQPPSKFEIRSVKRPSSTSRSDSIENGNAITSSEPEGSAPSKRPTPSLEKSLSKDDIAASLAAADKYLNKIQSNVTSTPDESTPWKHSSPYTSSPAQDQPASPVDSAPLVDSADDNQDTDGSVPYDNVADVLSELQASGHIKGPNTQQSSGNEAGGSSDLGTPAAVENNLKDANNVDDSTSYPGFPSNDEEHMDYDPVANSTQSVYLESKHEHHTYNNIDDFLTNKKRQESTTSDDEPYEVVASPIPPARVLPASLPLNEEPEPMSVEEAQNLLSSR